MLLVEQNVGEGARARDRAYVLEEGRIVAGGAPAELLRAAPHPERLPGRRRAVKNLLVIAPDVPYPDDYGGAGAARDPLGTGRRP